MNAFMVSVTDNCLVRYCKVCNSHSIFILVISCDSVTVSGCVSVNKSVHLLFGFPSHLP